jgi:hypothetical protein
MRERSLTLPEGGDYHPEHARSPSSKVSRLPPAPRFPHRRSRLRWYAVPVFLALAHVSCGVDCDRDRRSAALRIEEARAAHADIFAEETFRKATALAGRADEESRLQENRFVLSRSYSLAGRLYREAGAEAMKAAREGKANEGMARQEALNARYLAVQSVEGARAALKRARKAKGDVAVVKLLVRMDRLQETLSEIQARIDKGDPLAARDLGNRIVQESVRLEAEANRLTLGLPAPAGEANRLY